MKKLLLIGVALVAVVMFVTPASATDLELGGYYRIEQRYFDNPSLEKDGPHEAYIRHARFRFQPALIVSDALRFDFKADIFDGQRWGQEGGPKAKNTTSIDVDRLWMTVKVPFGSFAGGRMPGGAWGLTFGDDNEDYDRLRFDTKFGDVSTGVIYQKNLEQRYNSTDSDTYYLYGNYKANIGSIGLLGAYTNDHTHSAYNRYKYNLLPYADLQFGNFGVRGELIWGNGKKEVKAAGAADTDIEELLWNVEADFAFGPFKVTGGYAWVQGEDNDPTKEKMSNAYFGGIGDDWSPLLVMMDIDTLINGFAGDAVSGSLDPTDSIDAVAFSGVKLAYIQADFKINKDWKVWVVGGWATTETDKYYTGVEGVPLDDDIGKEADINVGWNIMKNLKAKFSFGYFWAGDFYKTFNGANNVDDTFTGQAQWTLSF